MSLLFASETANKAFFKLFVFQSKKIQCRVPFLVGSLLKTIKFKNNKKNFKLQRAIRRVYIHTTSK